MYGSNTYGGASYGDLGKPSDGNHYFQVNSDSFIVTETIFAIKIVSRVITDTLVMVETLLKAMSRSLTDAYQVADSFLKQTQKNLVESLILSEVIAIAGQFVRTLSDTFIVTSLLSAYGVFRRTLSDSLELVETTITKLVGKVFNLNISVSDVIRRYLNGLLVNPWTKVVKTVATFLKIAKPTATFTKTAKPTSLWTRTEKPY